jgi:hypothetical protein
MSYTDTVSYIENYVQQNSATKLDFRKLITDVNTIIN